MREPTQSFLVGCFLFIDFGQNSAIWLAAKLNYQR